MTRAGTPPDAAGARAQTPGARPRVQASFFEDLYERSEDPWSFETSEYEHQKYARTLESLDGRQFERALEVGCSIGVFTERLADVATELLAIDVSERALARARTRLNGWTAVSFARAAYPEEIPGGHWDLIVCSEILYYLDERAFDLAVEHLRNSLEAGSTVIAVHWRAPTQTYPLLGDEVHDRLTAALARWHACDARRPEYRLDRFES